MECEHCYAWIDRDKAKIKTVISYKRQRLIRCPVCGKWQEYLGIGTAIFQPVDFVRVSR